MKSKERESLTHDERIDHIDGRTKAMAAAPLDKRSSNGTTWIRQVSGIRTSRFWLSGRKRRRSRPSIPVKGSFNAGPEKGLRFRDNTELTLRLGHITFGPKNGT